MSYRTACTDGSVTKHPKADGFFAGFIKAAPLHLRARCNRDEFGENSSLSEPNVGVTNVRQSDY